MFNRKKKERVWERVTYKGIEKEMKIRGTGYTEREGEKEI